LEVDPHELWVGLSWEKNGSMVDVRVGLPVIALHVRWLWPTRIVRSTMDWSALEDDYITGRADDPTLLAKIGLEKVEFLWSTKHGGCYDCGLPAAFARDSQGGLATGLDPSEGERLCSVCAANAAADGEPIRRIDADVDA